MLHILSQIELTPNGWIGGLWPLGREGGVFLCRLRRDGVSMTHLSTTFQRVI